LDEDGSTVGKERAICGAQADRLIGGLGITGTAEGFVDGFRAIPSLRY
jgi:hypothetical protein